MQITANGFIKSGISKFSMWFQFGFEANSVKLLNNFFRYNPDYFRTIKAFYKFWGKKFIAKNSMITFLSLQNFIEYVLKGK